MIYYIYTTIIILLFLYYYHTTILILLLYYYSFTIIINYDYYWSHYCIHNTHIDKTVLPEPIIQYHVITISIAIRKKKKAKLIMSHTLYQCESMVKYGKGTSRHLSELTQSGFSWKSGTSDPMSPMADGLAMKFHLDPYLCVIFFSMELLSI